MNEAFVDLRVENYRNQADDSVWPSFTDIMTVVVMIFLMALVVILLRNVELVHQLRATMEAEREAAEIARTTEEQRDDLIMRLFTLEEEVSGLQVQLLKSRDEHAAVVQERQTAEDELLQSEQLLNLVRSQRDELKTVIQQLEATQTALATERDELTDKVAAMEQDRTRLISEGVGLRANAAKLAEEVAVLQESLAQQQAEMETLRKSQGSEQQRFAALEGDYVKLQRKYDLLVRPARTPIGKYVVEARYSKTGDQLQIELREPGQSYEVMSRDRLDARLTELKNSRSDKLYTKIVIPQNSGLSYSEAWAFTNDILSRYDYYYQ